MSHFTVVAAPRTMPMARARHRAWPPATRRAVKNADSHEYFAENTLAQN
ncbi:hypothetical protein [Xanthomonas theicola]|nr:hypothetical protein [Xanthomonas theicola]